MTDKSNILTFDSSAHYLRRLLNEALDLRLLQSNDNKGINYLLESYNYSAKIGRLDYSEKDSGIIVKTPWGYQSVEEGTESIRDVILNTLEEGTGPYVPIVRIAGTHSLSHYERVGGRFIETEPSPETLYYFDHTLLDESMLLDKL